MCEIAVLSLLLLSLFCVEALSLCLKAVGTAHTLVVDSRHGLVSRVTWQLNLIVFNNILFHNRVSALSAFQFRLSNCHIVKVGFRNETVVSRNVSSHLGGTHSEVMCSMRLFGCVVGKLVSWIMTIRTVRKIVFRSKI